jgi:hypothetical protein
MLHLEYRNEVYWDLFYSSYISTFLCCSCSGDGHDITFIHVKCHFPLSFPFSSNNDICPADFSVPTEGELSAETTLLPDKTKIKDIATAFSSFLKYAR